MNSKVSIIIPCYNHGKYISESIESALNQTYKNIEIVCVNDGSTDKSFEIIKKYADKYKCFLFFNLEKNEGVINARNLAIEAATGEYILPLDADDVIDPTYVEKAIDVLKKNSDIGIVYSKARKIGNEKGIWNLPKFDIDNFLYANCIFNCALFRKKDFIKVGGYRDSLSNVFEDWDLWLSFIELGLKPFRIDEVLFSYRKYDEISRSKLVAKNSNWKKDLLKNHFNLYLQNENFISKAFMPNQTKFEKYKKYKKLFNIFLFLFIAETVLILLAILFLNMRGCLL